MEEMKIGLTQGDRAAICLVLTQVLASSYGLYLKTQNFHWNVKGKEFYALHVMFQKQYEELAEVIDEVAERIRSLGGHAEGSFSAFMRHSWVKDEEKQLSAPEMLRKLVHDHEVMSENMRRHLPAIEKVEDGATADFINKRLASHEKVAWMLRSHSS